MEQTIASSRSGAQKFHRALDKLMREPPSQTVELPDPSFPGLSVRVGARGRPAWTYRFRFKGQQIREALGTYPEVTIAEAHEKVEAAQKRLRKGEDPFPPEEQPRTVEAVAEQFFREYASQRRYGPELRRMIEHHFVQERWGQEQISSITRRDIRDAVGRIKDRAQEKAAQRVIAAAGKKVIAQAEAAEHQKAKAQRREPDLKRARAAAAAAVKVAQKKAQAESEEARNHAGASANRVQTALHGFFEWALEQDYIVVNPCAGLKPVVEEVARERVLEPPEIVAVWRAVEELHPACRDVIRLLFLTGRRRDEVRAMRWSELNLEAGEWQLPSDRTKNKTVALTPLPPAAVSILKKIERIDGCDYVFSTTGKTAVSGWSRFKEQIDARAQLTEPWVVHDIRRTVATNLQQLGVRLEVTEAILGHISGSKAGVVGIYQRYDWYKERKAALRRWADRLSDIVKGRADSNVVTLRA